MRIKHGTVSSKSGDKTIVVTVHRYEVHPKYKKRYRLSSKFHAHDEDNTYSVGDNVVIGETRPLSKKKSWRVLSAEELSSLEKS